MSLSDEERRVLDEMERQLTGAEKIAVRAPRRANVRLAVIGFVVLLVGVGTLLAGVIVHTPLLGVLGFGAMVFGVMLMLNRRGETRPAAGAGRSTRGGSPSATFEQRWQRRIDGEL
jgi:predicted phage tail protein